MPYNTRTLIDYSPIRRQLFIFFFFFKFLKCVFKGIKNSETPA